MLSIICCAAFVAFWIRSYQVADRVVVVRYFTHVTPVWMLVEGFESDDGDLICTQAFTECITEDDVQRGNSSDFGELAIDRRKFPSFHTSHWFWQQDRPTKYVMAPITLLNRLGFCNRWDFGYRNPSWGHRMFIPYWVFAGLFASLPGFVVGRFALRTPTVFILQPIASGAVPRLRLRHARHA